MRWLMRKSTTAIIFWAGVIGLSVIVLLLGAMIIANKPWQQTPRNEAFTDFMNQVDQGTVSNVKIYEKDQTIDVEIENGKKYKTAFPPNFDLKKLLAGKVKTIDFDPQTNTSIFSIAIQIGPRVLLVVLILAFMTWIVLLIVSFAVRTTGNKT